jgi:asparagine synthetase B (glutamine-hydrolysing)
MSWILGAFGRISQELENKIRKFAQNSLLEFQDDQLLLRAGGIQETCKYGATTLEAWAVCGFGIEHSGVGHHLMEKQDWEVRLESKTNTHSLEGQFAGISYCDRCLTLFTDRIGSRDMWYCTIGGATLFSTRADWLARLSGNNEIDLDGFGGRWLFYYQVSTSSIIKNVERLGPGAVVKISQNGITKESTKWLPEPTRTPFSSTLEELVTFPFRSGQRMSLSLSGGLDSRLLFSILLHAKGEWDVHTFGPPDHPDVTIAKQIAKTFGVPHQNFYIDPLGDTDLESKVEDYCAQGLGLRQASQIMQAQYYPMLYRANTVIIDGGFGEVARRHMFNRLAYLGKAALLRRDSQAVFPYFTRFRGDFFMPEVNTLLRKGALGQIESLWNDMPDPNTFGVRNWLDMIVVRSELPNANAAEQARMDHYVQSYMPFVQPLLLNAVFEMPLKLREDSREVHAIIHRNEPKLERFPLMTSACTVPYSLSTRQSFLFQKVKRLLGKTYHDHTTENFLQRMRLMIEDISNSAEVRTCSLYDQQKVRSVIDGYYAGNKALGGQLDWWLGFELWRRSLSKEGM